MNRGSPAKGVRPAWNLSGGMAHSAGHVDRITEYTVKLEQAVTDLSGQILEMIELENRVRTEIEQLPDRQATIMHYRYLSVN